MRLIRIALMGLGIFYAASFTINFFQTLDQNQRYLEARETVTNGVENVQTTVSSSMQSVQNGFQSAQTNVNNSIESVQVGSSNLVSQFDDNALFIMLGILFILFIMRRALRRAD